MSIKEENENGITCDCIDYPHAPEYYQEKGSTGDTILHMSEDGSSAGVRSTTIYQCPNCKDVIIK